MIIDLSSGEEVAIKDAAGPRRGDRVGVFQLASTDGEDPVMIQGSLFGPADEEDIDAGSGERWVDLLDEGLTAPGAANVTIFPYMRITFGGAGDVMARLMT